ncbi:DNA repair protein rhp54 [Hordeum vulgare]|nr:DNA repair protein rhp54 [Hordeum vulgare]
MLPGAHNLFDRMPTAIDNERANRFMQSIIFKGDTVAAGGAVMADYDPEETQSRDGRGPFTSLTYNQAGMQDAVMQDQAEKQAKMLEIEAQKQAKMLETEATNAKTKAKKVVLSSMMTGVEIMMVDLNTVSPRKRPWFEKMQADMLKFDDK